MTYIGPADLSASHGHLGNMSHPEVQEAIDKVFDATKAAGKAAGVHMGSGKTIKERMEKGYEFITIGNNLSLLQRGTDNLMRNLGLR